ncbi:hypothetical protein ABWH92_10220 [Ahrensia marina]|uniref:hypothetical protein n=1 Tax=Ahrensia marina TaxID=1514904 RepID=UPI0035D04823
MFDWRDATLEQCKLFYEPIKRHVGYYGLDWKPFLDGIYEEMSGASSATRPRAYDLDMEGLSRGKLDRVKLNLIWRWLEKRDPAVARRILDEVRGIEPKRHGRKTDQSQHSMASGPQRVATPKLANKSLDPNRWLKFLYLRGTNSGVDIEVVPPPPDRSSPRRPRPERAPDEPDKGANRPSFPLSKEAEDFIKAAKSAPRTESVQLVPRNPLSKTLVQQHQWFRFKFEAMLSGPVLAIQKSRGPAWMLMPINGFDPYIPSDEAFRFLPLQKTDEPVFLSEEYEDGRHDFAFIFAPIQIVLPLVQSVDSHHSVDLQAFDDLVDYLEVTDVEWSILTLSVMFRP